MGASRPTIRPMGLVCRALADRRVRSLRQVQVSDPPRVPAMSAETTSILPFRRLAEVTENFIALARRTPGEVTTLWSVKMLLLWCGLRHRIRLSGLNRWPRRGRHHSPIGRAALPVVSRRRPSMRRIPSLRRT